MEAQREGFKAGDERTAMRSSGSSKATATGILLGR